MQEPSILPQQNLNVKISIPNHFMNHLTGSRLKNREMKFMSEQIAKKMDPKLCVKWGITILVAVILAMIPSNETVFTPAMKAFTVISATAILAFAFDLMSTTIIALLIPIAYWMFRVAPLEAIFKPWTQSTVWLMFGAVIMAACYDKTGIFKRITYWFMAKTGGSINAFIYGLIAIAVFGAYTGIGMQTIVYFLLVVGFCSALEVKKGSNLGAVLLYTAYIAGAAVGIILAYDPMFDIGMNMAKMVLADFVDVSVFNISYYTYALHNVVFMPSVFLMIWLATKVLKIDTKIGSKEFFQEQYQAMGKMSTDEKKCIGSAAFLFILFLTQKYTGFDVAICNMLAALWCFLPVVGFCDEQDLKQVNYSVPFFVAGTMCIGTVANVVGVGQIVAGMIVPFIGDNIYTNAFSIFIIGYVLNLLLTPIAAASVVSGPLILAVYQMGINPIPVMYTLVQGLNNVLFPYEGAYFLLMFSFGYMKMGQFVKLFTTKTILMLVWLLVFGVAWWKFLGLYTPL